MSEQSHGKQLSQAQHEQLWRAIQRNNPYEERSVIEMGVDVVSSRVCVTDDFNLLHDIISGRELVIFRGSAKETWLGVKYRL